METTVKRKRIYCVTNTKMEEWQANMKAVCGQLNIECVFSQGEIIKEKAKDAGIIVLKFTKFYKNNNQADLDFLKEAVKLYGSESKIVVYSFFGLSPESMRVAFRDGGADDCVDYFYDQRAIQINLPKILDNLNLDWL